MTKVFSPRRSKKKESEKAVESIFQELGLDLENFPVEPLEGSWI